MSTIVLDTSSQPVEDDLQADHALAAWSAFCERSLLRSSCDKQGCAASRISAPAHLLCEAGYVACLSALPTTCPGSQDLQGYGACCAQVVPSCQDA
jgi:hypothetical protein